MDKNSSNLLAYSVREAARIVGIGRTKFYAEIAAGRIQIKKVGRRTVVPARALVGWLDGLPGPKLSTNVSAPPQARPGLSVAPLGIDRRHQQLAATNPVLKEP